MSIDYADDAPTLEPLVSEPRADLSWQQDGLCNQTDPEAFYPEKGGSTREAKSVCVGCMVRAECLSYALDTDQRFGVWGGMSERERRKLNTSRTLPCDMPGCTDLFAATRDRDRHITMTHRATKVVTCSTCGKPFAFASQLARHAKIHETDTLEGTAS